MANDIRQRFEARASLLQQPSETVQQPSPIENQMQSPESQVPNQANGLRQRFEARLPEFQKQNRSALETYVKRPLDIGAASAVAGAQALPRTAFDFLKFIVQKTGGNIENLEKAQKESPEWLKKVASRVFPTFEEKRESQFKQGAVRPEGGIEKFIEKAGRFAGEAPLLGGIGGVKGAVGLTGAAAGMQIGEELELPPLAQAALSMGGALLGHKVGGGFKEMARQKITPEVSAYMQASREAGIDPLLTGMNPTQLQKVAQKWATHGIGGPEILENAYKMRSGQVAKTFEKALNEAGENLFETKFEAGQGLKESIQDATKQIEQNKSQLYRAVDATLPENATIAIAEPEAMANSLNKGIEILNDSLALSPPQSSTFRRLSELRSNIEQVLQHDPALMPVKRLEMTNRALNDIIRYDRPGGYDKMLIPISNQIKQQLNRYGKLNPKYQVAREAANEYFKNDVVHIRQNLLQSIARSERPESTLAIMDTVSGIKNVEKALNSLPNGRTLTESLKRYKLNSLIRDKIIDPSTGLMKVGGLKDFLSRKSGTYDIIKELAGQKSIQTLRSLEGAGKGLEKGFNNLVNPSKTADTLIALNSILSPAKNIKSGIGKIFKLKPIEGVGDILLGLGKAIAPKFVAKWVMNPESARKVMALSEAGRQGNWKAFNKILDSIDDEIKRDNKKNQQSKGLPSNLK